MTDPNCELPALQAKPFLSEIIEVEKLRKGQANIIVAPCHSGKTTAIEKIIIAHASRPEKVLLLIDTTAGKQAIISREQAVAYYKRWLRDVRGDMWGEFWDGNGFRVMTYHQFGFEVQHEPLFLLGIEIIICDEMHSLVKYRGIENSNNKKRILTGEPIDGEPCKNALSILSNASGSPSAPLIVIMTATVNSLSEELHRQKVPREYFDYTDKAHCDLTRNRIYYAHFEDIISKLSSDTHAIIYTAQIKQMLEFAKLADNGQRKICCLWGLHNPNLEMSKEQLAVRSTILKTQRIPPDIDLLFINAAYETSININNEDFNTMIIHNSNPDIQTQVRGRLRHDIETLYIYDSNHKHISQYFPAEYYDRPLFSQDTQDTDGTPIIKQISGDSELELADKIVNTILASTRRQEFLGTKSIEIVPSSPPFKKYAEEWMETYKIGKCKPTTISGYNSILNQYLYPEFGSLTMDQFTTKCIQRFLNEHKDASAKYLREIKNLLSQILECAKRDGHLSDNPARDPRISIPSAKKKERSALTLEQLNEILPVLEQLQGTEQLYLALVIYTGMRRGEVLGLRWKDIDLSGNVIHVVRNVTYVNNPPIFSTPKTQSGTRDIPIMPPLLKYLLPLKDDGYLIQNTRNKENPITLTMFKTMFKHIQNASDLNGATSHTFRHTLGTLLNDAGADVKTIQGILGQKDYKTTMDRYVHPVEKRKHEAVNKIGDMLSVSV